MGNIIMISIRYKVRGVLCLSVLLLVISWGSIGIAGSQMDLRNVQPHLFPVKLSGIVFQGGNKFDASDALGFGEWAVSFGVRSPVAYYRCESPCVGSDPPPLITINGLKCDNPAFGETRCSLLIELYKKQPTDCTIEAGGNVSEPVLIDCPVAFELR